MDKDFIIVGAHQDFEEGKLVHQRAVQVRDWLRIKNSFIWEKRL